MKRYFYIICMAAFALFAVLMFSGFSLKLFLFKVVVYSLFCFVLYKGLLKDRDWFSPFTLFSSFYFCLLLYSSKVSQYYIPELSSRSMVLIIAGSIVFWSGMLVYRGKNVKRRLKTLLEDSMWATRSVHVYSHWYLLLIGLLPTIYLLATKKLPALAWQGLTVVEIQELRLTYHLPVVSTLGCLVTVAIIVAIRSRKKMDILIVSLVSLGNSTILFAKASIVLTLFSITYGIYRYRLFPKIKYRTALIVAGIAIFLLFNNYFNYIRGGFQHERLSVFERSYIYGRADYFPKILMSYFSIYMYITAPFSNCDYIMEHIDNYKMGKMMLWPIISLTQLKRLYNIQPEYKPIRAYPYNTHTFLADFYMDFGIAGCLILPFILGVLVYFLYLRALKSSDTLVHAEYLFWGYATFMMFFSNHFTSVGYPVRNILIIEAYRLLVRSFKGRVNK